MTLRTVFFWLHLTAGVVAGAIILLMSATGVALTFERQPQRYTRLSKNVYKFEALSTGFEAQLTVNDEGLVVDYEGLWKAVVPQPEKEKIAE